MSSTHHAEHLVPSLFEGAWRNWVLTAGGRSFPIAIVSRFVSRKDNRKDERASRLFDFAWTLEAVAVAGSFCRSNGHRKFSNERQ